MKILACVVLAIGGLASPVLSFAQSTEPVTRAQVRANLIRLEEAGYRVGDGDSTTYPAQIQAAELKISAQDSQQVANTAVGGTTMNGTSAAGSAPHLSNLSPSSCAGPASYCNIFFGN
ncbi:mitochondrial fission protein ELM1 [Paraburkholderia sp. Clong3]